MSAVFGAVSLLSLILAVTLVIKDGGTAAFRMGAVGFMSGIFCIAGLVLGIMALMEKDKFMFFPRLGFIMSLIAGIAWGGIIYAGIA